MKNILGELLTAVVLLGLLLFVIAQVSAAEPQFNPPELTPSPVQAMVLGGKFVHGVDITPATAPVIEKPELINGAPITAVIVTQCNLLWAVYVTMSDGRLLRFDQTAKVASEQLLELAMTATRSQRIEVACSASEDTKLEKSTDPL